MRAASTCLGLLALASVACSGSSPTPGGSNGGSSGCAPGQSAACVASNGCQGTQTCFPDGGGFGSCQCPTGGGQGGTGGGTSGGNRGSGDAGAQLGSLCSQGWDCLSGVCVSIGGPTDAGQTGSVCSVGCGNDAGCLAGWSCGPWDGGAQSVCQCQWSPEVCDGRDDDCNGTIDDQPAADDSCDAGESCVAGVCS